MRPHTIVVDLGFGDAGKGTVVDRLCARGPEPVHAVVRFNGGAQAAHNVVTDDGRHHTFAQFGSGTFTPGVRTHLSRFVLVDPLALAAEADHLAAVGVPDAFARLTVDERALLVTPYHRAANRARELARGAARHGSCGMGIGETAAYALTHPTEAPRAADCHSPTRLNRVLTALHDRYRAEFPDGPPVPPAEDCAKAFQAFADRVTLVDDTYLAALLAAGPVVFEGAQGVLLDEDHGFHPHTTWSTTTFKNAEALLAESGTTRPSQRLGVLRTYTTRHGPGPFVTEDPTLTLPDPHNTKNPWQGTFRVGHLDEVALRYAAEACGGIDALAITHMDVAASNPDLLRCTAYELPDEQNPLTRLPHHNDLTTREHLTTRLLTARPIYEPLGDPITAAETATNAPAVLLSHGPRTSDKHWTGAGRPSHAAFGAANHAASGAV
nr:adenylosuccinate synthetase [Actinomadura atramentaria]